MLPPLPTIDDPISDSTWSRARRRVRKHELLKIWPAPCGGEIPDQRRDRSSAERELRSHRQGWILGGLVAAPRRDPSTSRLMPMAVTWRLRHPLSGDLFAGFAAAVA